MKKTIINALSHLLYILHSHFSWKMRVYLTLSFILAGQLFSNVLCAQTAESKITFGMQNKTLEYGLNELGKLSDYRITFTLSQVSKYNNITINKETRTIRETLNLLLSNTDLTFTIKNGSIVIIERSVSKPSTTENTSLRQISGIVTDNGNESLPGVNIRINNSSKGTITNSEGRYTIEANKGDLIVYSFIGYQPIEQKVTDKTVYNIQLSNNSKLLDEVQVIGYGVTSKRTSTASVSSLNAVDIAKQPIANPLVALQGRVAGADIIQANGLPGSSVNILIRGKGSISNGTIPLYIIDGVPFNINDQSIPASNNLNSFGISAANRGISPFSMINPSDIERIDVLKDADATAIYGTKAANGVILITTKKGKAGKTKVDINLYQGVGSVSHFIDLMDTKQYLAMRQEALKNDGLTASASNAPDLVTWDATKNTNWQKQYIGGSAKTTDAQTTISGGDDRTKFLLGAGYRKETTVYSGDWGNERLSARFNAEHSSLDRKFFVSISTLFSHDKTNLMSTDLATVYNLPPNLPLYNSNGSLYWDNNFTNPEAYLKRKYVGSINNLSSNIMLRYSILPGLDLKTSIGYNDINTNQNQQTPAISQNPNSSPTNNATFATMNQQGYIIEPQAVYTQAISKGKLTALLGGTWQQSLNKTQSITATGYSSSELLGTLAGASSYSISYIYNTLYRYNSVFGRLTYDWEQKYILNANIRRDGSSRFGANNRWGTFGSLGAAWVFTKEKFIAEVLPFVSFGKLRASYGITGNDQLQDYQYMTTLSSANTNFTYQGTSVLYPSRINNPDLHWETTKKFEAALDLGFLNDRITFTVNAYRNRSDNQLGSIILSTQAGFNSYTGNLPALLQNQGLEFELNTKNIVNNTFSWTSSFNLTIPQNKILSVDPTYYYASTYTLGESLSQAKRYVYLGMDPATGNLLYKNQTTGASTTTPSYNTDRALVGDTDPKFYGGLSNTLTYKSFELSFFFQFKKQDGNIYPSSTPGILTSGNQTTYWLGRWTSAADNTMIPRYTTQSSVYSYNYSGSTALWGDNSFVKLKNATISYLVPSKHLQKLKISSLRVYLQGQNLYTWTKNIYVYDPETGTSMPQLRTISVGINCSL